MSLAYRALCPKCGSRFSRLQMLKIYWKYACPHCRSDVKNSRFWEAALGALFGVPLIILFILYETGILAEFWVLFLFAVDLAVVIYFLPYFTRYRIARREPILKRF